MRWSLGSAGLNVALSEIDLRGPVVNCQTTPSVSPSKWQLEHDCQPSLESRSLVEAEPLGALSNCPREPKNIKAPTISASGREPAPGRVAVRTTRTTRSARRSTTEMLRDRTLSTHALVPAALMAMPCGLWPGSEPAARSM